MAAFDFNILYIPGHKNMVADALSREPLVRPRFRRRLTITSHADLLKEAKSLQVGSVQDMFRLSSELSEAREQQAASMSHGVCVGATHVIQCEAGGRGSSEEVSAVLHDMSSTILNGKVASDA